MAARVVLDHQAEVRPLLPERRNLSSVTTYRIARLTCTTCNTVQRVRVAVDATGETFPGCPDCGPTVWSVDDPSVPVLPPTVEPDALRALPEEVAEFWRDMAAERNEYYERRFEEWKAERTERRSRLADVYHHDLARMFREVFDLLG